VAFRLELHDEGFRQLLNGPEVTADLERRGNAIAAAAGEGFEVRTVPGRTRVRVSIFTADIDAIIAEATDHVLTLAIDAGRV
jgi:hypothetical protein